MALLVRRVLLAALLLALAWQVLLPAPARRTRICINPAECSREGGEILWESVTRQVGVGI